VQKISGNLLIFEKRASKIVFFSHPLSIVKVMTMLEIHTVIICGEFGMIIIKYRAVWEKTNIKFA
jgi:hypothetical protein